MPVAVIMPDGAMPMLPPFGLGIICICICGFITIFGTLLAVDCDEARTTVPSVGVSVAPTAGCA